MPLLRRLIKVGNSRAVIIPPDWLKYHEDKQGRKVEVMLMEVDNIITLAVREGDTDEIRKQSQTPAGTTSDKGTG